MRTLRRNFAEGLHTTSIRILVPVTVLLLLMYTTMVGLELMLPVTACTIKLQANTGIQIQPNTGTWAAVILMVKVYDSEILTQEPLEVIYTMIKVITLVS